MTRSQPTTTGGPAVDRQTFRAPEQTTTRSATTSRGPRCGLRTAAQVMNGRPPVGDQNTSL